MDWFFDGLGTFLVGLVLGAGGGSVVTWRISSRRIKQYQRAGEHASQVQVGGNQEVRR